MNSFLFGMLVALAAGGLLFIDSMLMHLTENSLVIAGILCVLLGIVAGFCRSMRYI